MRRKIISILLAVCLTCSLTACGGKTPEKSEEPVEKVEQTEETGDELEEESDALDAIGEVETEQKLFNVEITVPADFVEYSTQEELDALAKENGFKSITLHEDGSATYVMTKAQHKEMMDEMKTTFNDAFAEMIGSEDYPNFTEITANDDFTKFTIKTKSTELDFAESFSVLVFYMYGGMYNIFNGTTVDNIQVDFVNAETGEIINSANSSEMGE